MGDLIELFHHLENVKKQALALGIFTSVSVAVSEGLKRRGVKALSARDAGNQNMSLAFHFGMCNSLATFPRQESGVLCGPKNYD